MSLIHDQCEWEQERFGTGGANTRIVRVRRTGKHPKGSLVGGQSVGNPGGIFNWAGQAVFLSEG